MLPGGPTTGAVHPVPALANLAVFMRSAVADTLSVLQVCNLLGVVRLWLET